MGKPSPRRLRRGEARGEVVGQRTPWGGAAPGGGVPSPRLSVVWDCAPGLCPTLIGNSSNPVQPTAPFGTVFTGCCALALASGARGHRFKSCIARQRPLDLQGPFFRWGPAPERDGGGRAAPAAADRGREAPPPTRRVPAPPQAPWTKRMPGARGAPSFTPENRGWRGVGDLHALLVVGAKRPTPRVESPHLPRPLGQKRKPGARGAPGFTPENRGWRGVGDLNP